MATSLRGLSRSQARIREHRARWAVSISSLLAACVLAAVLPISTASAQDKYLGVFDAGTDAYQVVDRKDWGTFVGTWTYLSGAGFRLIDIETYLDGGTRYYSGVFRAGTGGYVLYNANPTQWNAQFAAVAGSQRLVDFERYELNNGDPMYIGVWREATDANDFVIDRNWTQFVADWTANSNAGLRLVDMETWEDSGGTRRYSGVFRAGTGGYYMLAEIDFATLVTNFNDLAAQDLRLVDVEKYEVNGEERYLAVWLNGTGAYGLWAGVDYENIASRIHNWAGLNLRIIDLETCPGCEAACSDQVVSTSAYNYQVTGDSVYRWPVDVDGQGNWLRHSAVQFSGTPSWVLPFLESSVVRGGTWLYSPNSWHHAIDFFVPGGNDTFAVTSSSDGQVVATGWDLWSGNYVTVSYNVGGVNDAYRTISMHLRDGASSDCNRAWTQTVPWLGSGTNYNEYVAHLNATGCTQDPATRNLSVLNWGTDDQTIGVSVGDPVAAGDFLARAGNTGPGGKRGVYPAGNLHLHIFYARRDVTNNNWYFVDPYGIYGPGNGASGCYPTNLSDPITGPCARYPNLWLNGQPQLPVPEPQFLLQLMAGCLPLVWIARVRRGRVA